MWQNVVRGLPNRFCDAASRLRRSKTGSTSRQSKECKIQTGILKLENGRIFIIKISGQYYETFNG